MIGPGVSCDPGLSWDRLYLLSPGSSSPTPKQCPLATIPLSSDWSAWHCPLPNVPPSGVWSACQGVGWTLYVWALQELSSWQGPCDLGSGKQCFLRNHWFPAWPRCGQCWQTRSCWCCCRSWCSCLSQWFSLLHLISPTSEPTSLFLFFFSLVPTSLDF